MDGKGYIDLWIGREASASIEGRLDSNWRSCDSDLNGHQSSIVHSHKVSVNPSSACEEESGCSQPPGRGSWHGGLEFSGKGGEC